MYMCYDISNFEGTPIECITLFRTIKVILGCLTVCVNFHAPGSIVNSVCASFLVGAPHIIKTNNICNICEEIVEAYSWIINVIYKNTYTYI